MCFYLMGRWNVSWNENEMDREHFKNQPLVCWLRNSPSQRELSTELAALDQAEQEFFPTSCEWAWMAVKRALSSAELRDFWDGLQNYLGGWKGNRAMCKEADPAMGASMGTILGNSAWLWPMWHWEDPLINRGAGRRPWDRVGEGILWNLYLQIQFNRCQGCLFVYSLLKKLINYGKKM